MMSAGPRLGGVLECGGGGLCASSLGPSGGLLGLARFLRGWAWSLLAGHAAVARFAATSRPAARTTSAPPASLLGHALAEAALGGTCSCWGSSEVKVGIDLGALSRPPPRAFFGLGGAFLLLLGALPPRLLPPPRRGKAPRNASLSAAPVASTPAFSWRLYGRRGPRGCRFLRTMET